MALWSLRRGDPTSVVDLSFTTTTTVTASATANTKGAWVELVAATSADWSGFHLIIGPNNGGATDTSALMDIGVGGAGSEIVLVSNIATGGRYLDGVFEWPGVPVPAGSRVVARMQCATGSRTQALTILGLSGYVNGDESGGVVTLGANTATSRGVTVTPGDSAWGAWAEVAASTTYPARRVGICVQGNGVTTRTASRAQHFQVGVGASGSEVAVAEGWTAYLDTGERIQSGWFMYQGGLMPFAPIEVSIPEGARVSVRAYGVGSSHDPSDVTVYTIS